VDNDFIKITKNKDGEIERIDIDNSILNKTGEQGTQGIKGEQGAKGIKGEQGAKGDSVTGKDGKDGKDYSPKIEKQVKENSQSILSEKKETQKVVKDINEDITVIEENIYILDSNLQTHIKNKSVHFDDKKQKEEIINLLKKPEIYHAGGRGGGISEAEVLALITANPTAIPPHNDLTGLQGGLPDEYYHFNEDQYNLLMRLDEDSAGLTFDGLPIEDTDLSGYVPYVGATTDVDLGTHTITAEQFTSTDDITMQGHLLTLGDGTATDIVISFNAVSGGSIQWDESESTWIFNNGNISTGAFNITGSTITASTALVTPAINGPPATNIIITPNGGLPSSITLAGNIVYTSGEANINTTLTLASGNIYDSTGTISFAIPFGASNSLTGIAALTASGLCTLGTGAAGDIIVAGHLTINSAAGVTTFTDVTGNISFADEDLATDGAMDIGDGEAYTINSINALNLNGTNNISIGNLAMAALAGGTYNVAIGTSTFHDLTSGDFNVGIGYQCGYYVTTGDNNVALGYRALARPLTTTSNNTCLGSSAGYKITGNDNVAIGKQAIGQDVSNMTGTGNIAIGKAALFHLFSATNYNTAIGANAGFYLTIGDENTYIGQYAGRYNQLGNANVYIGTLSGGFGAGGVASNSNNTTVGYKSGYSLQTGSNNILLGYQAGDVITTGSNNIIIGYDIDPSGAAVSSELNIGGIIWSPAYGTDVRFGAAAGANYAAISNAGDIDLYGTANNIENHTGDLTIKSAGTLYLESVTEVVKTGGTGTNCYSSLIGSIGGNDRVASWQIQDATDTMQLTRDNVAITKYEMLMPVDIGDGTNKVVISTTGDLSLNGSATVWNDVNVGAVTLSRPSSSQPDEENFLDEAGADTGITTLAFAIGEKVSGSFEVPHDYKEGSDITFHIHWEGIVAPSGTDNVQWRISYVLMRDDTTLDAVTTIDTADTAIDTQYKSYRSDFGVIDGATKGNNGSAILIGDQFLFTLERVAATGDVYNGDALVATVGLHYECDTIGSKTILAK